MSRPNRARRRVRVHVVAPLAAATALTAVVAVAQATTPPSPTDPAPATSPTPVSTPSPGSTFDADCSIGSTTGLPGRISIVTDLPPAWAPGTVLGPTGYRFAIELDSLSNLGGPHVFIKASEGTAIAHLKPSTRSGQDVSLPASVTSDPVSANDPTFPKRWSGVGHFPTLTAPPEGGTATFTLRSLEVTAQEFTPGGTPIDGWYTSSPPESDNPSVSSIKCVPNDPATFATVALTTPTATPTPSPIPDPPPPTATPTVTPSPEVTPIVNSPGPPTPTPTAIPEPPNSYPVAGSTQLKTLTKGSVPVSGKLVVTRNSPDLVGDLTLASGIAKLSALGFVPMTARLTFVPQSQFVGKYANTTDRPTATATIKEQLKISNVTLFGVGVNVGANCGTAGPVTLNLSGSLSVWGGGTLAGTYAIGPLANCGNLTGLLSPVVAGSGNAIALKFG